MFGKTLIFVAMWVIVIAGDVKKRSPDDRLEITNGQLNYNTVKIPKNKPEVVVNPVVAHVEVPAQSTVVKSSHVAPIVSHVQVPVEVPVHQTVVKSNVVPSVHQVFQVPQYEPYSVLPYQYQPYYYYPQQYYRTIPQYVKYVA